MVRDDRAGIERRDNLELVHRDVLEPPAVGDEKPTPHALHGPGPHGEP